MTAWKIVDDDGTNYAAATGFTFPTGYNPEQFEKPTTRNFKIIPIPYSDRAVIMDIGMQSCMINIKGRLYSESSFNSLKARTTISNMASTGYLDIKGRVQKLYFGDSNNKYYYIRVANFVPLLISTDPLAYAYNISAQLFTPFMYYDSVTDYPAGGGGQAGSGATPLVINITGCANADSTAYVFPDFRIDNTGTTTVTQVVITDGTNTLTWVGTLAANKTLYIIQEVYVLQGIYSGLLSWVGNTSGSGYVNSPSGYLSGPNRVVFDVGASGKTITFTLTAASGTIGATAYVKLRKRDW